VKFVGDITYVHTSWQGFVYLATVIDCYSKKVVGWQIADHIRAELVEDALRHAAATCVIEPRAIFHSDRGSVYISGAYRALIGRLGMRSSMGRTGVCWDNSMAESFFSALKDERVYRTVYATKSQARRDLIRYIEGFYNSRRRHSSLGYQYPKDVHYAYQRPATAASAFNRIRCPKSARQVKPLVRTFGVMDLVKAVDLLLQLQLLEGLGEGLLVEESEQGLVEAFVLALRGRLIGFAGDRLHPERGDIGDELTQDAAAGRIQRCPVIAQ